MNLINIVEIFIIAFLLSLVGTAAVRTVAIHLNVIDKLDERRVHQQPTPLLGGLAIFAAAISVMSWNKFFQGPAMGALIGGFVILLVGLWDDLKTINPKEKLIGQLIAASVLLPFGILVKTSGIFFVDAALTIFWVVGISNAFNLIDNMDGLSAGIAALSGFFFFIIATGMEQIVVGTASLALCAACLGFLWHNFGHMPARIFMGDTGSLFVGYVLAVIAIRLVYESTVWVAPFVPIAILGVPILDTTSVVIGRTLRGCPISCGGKDHLSHRLVAALGLPNRAVVGMLWLLAMALDMGAAFLILPRPFIGIVSMAFLLLFFGLLLKGKFKKFLIGRRSK